jgi:hypothetical protein
MVFSRFCHVTALRLQPDKNLLIFTSHCLPLAIYIRLGIYTALYLVFNQVLFILRAFVFITEAAGSFLENSQPETLLKRVQFVVDRNAEMAF